MPPKTLLTRYLPTTRKIVGIAIIWGVLCALAFGGAAAVALHHKRADALDLLARNLSGYVTTLFNDLKNTTDQLQPLAFQECAQVGQQLTSRAAFSLNVRAFLLVRDQTAYCSSATGAMSMHMVSLTPRLNLNLPLDMSILPGTPMLPDKPAISVWFRNPVDPGRGIFTTLNIDLTSWLLHTARERDVTGVALIIKDQAIATFSPQLIDLKNNHLDTTPIRIASVSGYPMAIWLYGESWPLEDIQLTLLIALLAALPGALASGYLQQLRIRSGKEILAGIRRNQFFVVYQPVIDSKSLTMIGVEVLMRWERPGSGLVPPDVFISYAESQQSIIPLTRHLFALIARDADSLKQLLPAGGKLGVNLAPSHLYSPSFKQDILHFARSIHDSQLQIVFEITERDMLKEEESIAIFQWLHDNGFEIAVDDFGTGHSALIYLERFTLDYLKIDRGFIQSIGLQTVTTPVLEAVLSLARRLNMKTVAEGVETPQQARWLIDQGVTYLQGYYFSPGLPMNQLREWAAQPIPRPDSGGN